MKLTMKMRELNTKMRIRYVNIVINIQIDAALELALADYLCSNKALLE